MDAAVLAARVLLAAVFAVAGAAKLRDRPGTLRTLAEFGLAPAALPAATLALPAIELVVALAMLVDPAAAPGGVAAAVLLAAFTAGILNALRQGLAPDCGCFGNLSAKPVSRWTVARNLFLLLLALFVAVRGSTAEIGAGLALAALVIALLIALAVSRRRRVATFAGVTVADTVMRGLEPGVPAPEFRLQSAAGGTYSLGSLRERGLPIVVLFLDSGCGSCRELHPHLRRWQRALRDRLALVVVMRGEPSAATALTDEHGVTDVLVDHGFDPLSARFQITSTPSAVVVGSDGRIGSRPVRGAAAIEELVRQTIKLAEDVGKWKQPTAIR
jgi:thiol-disulfide isomerase/thioredoxin/uncharacterized membrane protein YphA (DoxX/SURF4 family)